MAALGTLLVPVVGVSGAMLLLGERPGWIPMLGALLVAAGIFLVAELGRVALRHHHAGVMWGLITGLCIASYTLNDGWAVKYLAISPILVDYSGNFFRVLVLAPHAWADRRELRQEIRTYARPALLVGILGPLGYILVLWAMTRAPISHVAPARELATLVGTWFGSRLLQEQIGWRRLVGALSIVAGVVCLAASSR